MIQLLNRANGKYYKLDKVTILGRVKGQILFKNDSAISSQHLEITVKKGEVYVKDLGSSNGTFINNEKLEPNKVVKLEKTDTLLVGKQSFVIVEPESFIEMSKQDASAQQNLRIVDFVKTYFSNPIHWLFTLFILLPQWIYFWMVPAYKSHITALILPTLVISLVSLAIASMLFGLVMRVFPFNKNYPIIAFFIVFGFVASFIIQSTTYVLVDSVMDINGKLRFSEIKYHCKVNPNPYTCGLAVNSCRECFDKLNRDDKKYVLEQIQKTFQEESSSRMPASTPTSNDIFKDVK